MTYNGNVGITSLLTDEVAKHMPQSAMVSTVMLSNARRIMGASDFHRAETLWNGQCLAPRIIPVNKENEMYQSEVTCSMAWGSHIVQFLKV